MGGSKSQTVGYQYFVGMHMVTCLGPCDPQGLLEIRIDNKLAFTGPQSPGRFIINKPDLFGGDSREGGVKGYLSFLTGHKAQSGNSYLNGVLGGNVPNFRGVVSFILEQMYLGMNPYLKPWAFKLQRIHTRQDGVEQWYDEKAAIAVQESGDAYLASFNLATTFPVLNNGNPGYPTPTSLYPASLTLGPFPQTVRLVSGDANGANPANGDDFLVFDGVQYGSSPAVAIPAGTEIKVINGGDTCTVQVKNTINPQSGASGYLSVIGSKLIDMNPAHIIRECLTDPDWGMGQNEADIDDDNFRAAADQLFDEGFGLSFLWDRQDEIGNFIETVCRHIDAAVFVDRTTGLWVIKLIRDDYDVEDLIHLTEDDIDKVEDFKRAQFGELTTEVTVKYWDGGNNVDAAVKFQDIALEKAQQASVTTTLQYPGITKGTLAMRVAQRDAYALGSTLASCTVYTNRKAKPLQVGSVFKMSWPDEDLEEVVMRVTKIAYGDGRNNRIRLTCSEDVFALSQKVLIPTVPPSWEDPNGPPTAVTVRKAFEVPYLEIVQQQGQTDTDAILADAPETGYVGSAGKRPADNALNAQLWTNPGAGFVNAGTLDFCPTATLTGELDRVTTIFPISNPNSLGDVLADSWAQIGEELCAVVSIATDFTSMEVERACLDTVPAIHPAGTVIFFWDNASGLDETQYVEGEDVELKLLTASGTGTLALEDAPTDTVTIVGRASRPYPPGNVKLNGEYFPAMVDSEPVLTWAHRNRLQQTGAELVGFPEGSIGPEPGTTYTVTVKHGVTTLRTATGISGTTYTYTTAFESADGGPYDNLTLELKSVRDGRDSYQFHSITVARPVPIEPTGIFVPDTGANVPLTLLWNNNRFIFSVKGKVSTTPCVGVYAMADDFSGVPVFLGMTLDSGRASYVPTSYNFLDRRVVAGGIDEVFLLFWGCTLIGDQTADGRFLMFEDDSVPKFEIADTSTTLNADVVGAVRKANGDFIAIAAVDHSSAPTLPAKVYKSSNDGRTWTSLGNTVGWGAEEYISVEKLFELADGSLWGGRGFYGAKNTAGDGINWTTTLILPGTLGNYSSGRFMYAYDGTALLVVVELVLAPQYPVVVSGDGPVSWFRYGEGRAPNVILVDEVTGFVGRFSPGVGLLGAGLSQVAGLMGGSSIACKNSVRTYIEPRTEGNGPVNFIQGTTDFSIEFWLKASGDAIDTSSDWEMLLFSQTKLLTGSGWYYQIQLSYTVNSHLLRLRIRGLSGNPAIAGAVECDISATVSNLFNGSVYHIVVTRGASGRAAIYLNKVAVASRSSGTISDLTAGSLAAGTVYGNDFGGNAFNFPSILDECAIYTRELSSAEVTEHYDTALSDGKKRNRIYRSTDNGGSFTQVRDVLQENDIDAGVINEPFTWDYVVPFGGGFCIYGHPVSTNFFPYVLKSTDHGATWAAKARIVTDSPTDDATHSNSLFYNAIAHGTKMLAGIAAKKIVSSSVYPDFYTSSDGINFATYTGVLPIGVAGAGIRATEIGNYRVTETGDVRVPE